MKRILLILSFVTLWLNAYTQTVGISDDNTFVSTSLLHIKAKSTFVNDIFTCGKDASVFLNITNGGEVWVNQQSPYIGDIFSTTTSADGKYAVNGYNISAVASTGGGIYGEGRAANTKGVWGVNKHASGTGVVGVGNGISSTTLIGGSGGAFASTNVGIFAYGDATANSWGVWGESAGDDGIGVAGIANGGGTVNIGTYGVASGGVYNFGLYSDAAVGIGQYDITCVNGANGVLNIGDASFIRITGPSAAYSITGFNGGYSGRLLFVYGFANQPITITNNSAPAGNNRILTLSTFYETGVDGATDVNGVNSQNKVSIGTFSAIFIYDGGNNRWILISWNP